jgi:hypothetical protein
MHFRTCAQAALTFQAGQLKTAVVANRSQRSHDLNKVMMGVHTGEGPHRLSQQQCQTLVSDGEVHLEGLAEGSLTVCSGPGEGDGGRL